MFELFEHTADLGLRVRAADLEALFVDAAQGLAAAIAGDISSIVVREQQSFVIAGTDLDYLLFDWLNELLYTFEARRMLFVQFEVQVSETGLQATAGGEPWDPQRHPLEHEVKAITYHDLRVEHGADGWLAEVILDI